MIKEIGLRVLRLLATILAVSFLTFLLGSLLPGDPINVILPPDADRDPVVVAEIREELGLDDPFFVRYGTWLGNAATGDLGYSYITDQPVFGTILDKLPVSAELAILATALALLMAVPLGILGGYREGAAVDKASSVAVQTGLAIPNFIVGVFLIWALTEKWQILPSTGWNRISEGIGPNLKTAILPALALSLSPMAFYTRLLRNDMISTLKEDFVLSARAKGLSPRYILARHALRPSSLSLVTIVGIQMGVLLGGTVVIEEIFALPGLGGRLLDAIFQRDLYMVQGITVFVATVYVILNTLVDFAYLAVDPRIRKR